MIAKSFAFGVLGTINEGIKMMDRDEKCLVGVWFWFLVFVDCCGKLEVGDSEFEKKTFWRLEIRSCKNTSP